ncbi:MULTISPECIES: ABC transporter substrate-binding protein [Streptomyces]|uniref:ABC transporter substrate-binding protein n=1 Tax=Streptomyces cyaneofuscatus TaxID=66883 RepID=A0ABZ1F4K2_9ACTN|nr:ABC transporter substrate-binding protein [Streptomyces cyaneofuscatus]WSB11219.1 ABC transporter substrate-binding protein [Streptomyces cyaneofuscatus]WSD45248.1 ABC transporter substrate-binding protein [Streptomyces cyaneofuscatus]WTA88442.1 ABC transporter substrate-binding protein [Streptomyces cyaneofuscatus]
MTRRGGTLRYAGRGDVDHLDTVCANYTASAVVERAYARQLVSHRSTDDGTVELVADLAEQLPTRERGDVSGDGRSYTFTLRDGACWNTPEPRQVSAYDMARGLRRLGNPVARCPLLSYYTDTIEGMRAYCEGFARVPGRVDALAEYLEGAELPGIEALDERTLVIRLLHPTPDFLDMMTLPFASAAPAEYLRHLPASADFDAHLLSDGPYVPVRHVPGEQLVLERNPAWRQDSDPVRGQYVDRITVTLGLSQREASRRVDEGTADALWDVAPELESTETSAVRVSAANGELNPCLLINTMSPNEAGATGRLLVRQALQYAVDKRAVASVYGDPLPGTLATQLLPPGNPAHTPFDLYPTPGFRGDPDRARRLLAEAGYPDGLTLRMIHRDAGHHPAVAEAVRTGLARAGITVLLQAVGQAEFYAGYLDVADRARQGVWDITTQGWLPDWQGNNARSYLQPHFDSSDLTADDATWGVCYGFYRSAETNRLIRSATTAEDHATADAYYRQADRRIMADAAVVPIMYQDSATLHSRRVRGFTSFPNYLGDPTRIWLEAEA